MDTATTITISSWLIPLISGIAGALIGTFCGAYFLHKYQESDKEKIRDIAIQAVEIFKSYKGKSFVEAQNEFNNKLTLSEKRAVLVALNKLGIPIEIPFSQPFNINEVCLCDEVISIDFLDDIITQLSKGLCDHLFFNDVEQHFSSNLRLMTLRKLAQRYVKNVLQKSIFVQSDNTIRHVPNWQDEFSPGELETIWVFRDKIANPLYYNIDGHPDSKKLDKLIKEIEIGLWDSYLFWDVSSYQNIKNQNTMATLMTQMMSNNNVNQTRTTLTEEPKR
ncbi:MAG: hypothetical protein K2M83_00135 [Muribaculaceae bacterium]|nr:hypothetical protein [Muribaculaceae bacterium]